MPKPVKPMDPLWLAAYNLALPTLTKKDKKDIEDAIAEYNNQSDAAAAACNAILLSIVPY